MTTPILVESGSVASPKGRTPWPNKQVIWLASQTDPQSPWNCITVRLAFKKPVAVPVMQEALDALVSKHQELRMCYGLDDGILLEWVGNATSVPLLIVPDTLPWRGHDWKPDVWFDLEQGRLIHAWANTINNRITDIIVSTHHIAADADSISIILRDLSASCLGTSAVTLERPPAEETTGSAPAIQDSADYWTRVFHEPPAPVEWVCGSVEDAPREQRVELDAVRLLRLRTAAHRQGSSAFCLLISILARAIFRVSLSAKVAVCVPVSVRDADNWEAVGYFINPVPLLVARQTSGHGLPTQVRQQLREAKKHSRFTYPEIVRAVRPPRLPGRSPLSQVLVNFTRDKVIPSGAFSRQVRFLNGGSTYDLSVDFVETDDGLSVYFAVSSIMSAQLSVERISTAFFAELAAALEAETLIRN